VAAIYAEQPIETIKARLRDGRSIEGLSGRPDADLATLERTTRAVAVMGAEPIRAGLEGGADVVITDRSSDCAIFAAPLLAHGFAPGIAYDTGKLMECASFCAEPYMGKDSIMGAVEGDGVEVP
jgi:hypothetical protein